MIRPQIRILNSEHPSPPDPKDIDNLATRVLETLDEREAATAMFVLSVAMWRVASNYRGEGAKLMAQAIKIGEQYEVVDRTQDAI